MRRIVAVAVATLLAATMSGCFGEGRSDWAYDVTQLSEASDRGLSGAGVRIGVLDTGIDVDHPSLDHLVDGDRDNGELLGFQDHIRDRFGVSEAYDDIGHGTHVIGIMAARGSSFGDKILYGGVDLKGGSPSALYYVAKVCDTQDCPTNAILDALAWMRQVGVDVVSLSLGGDREGPVIINDDIRNAIDSLIDRGTVVVASAGNDGDDGSDVNAPADIPGVIAVGAIDSDGRVADLSNRGENGGFNTCRTVPLGGTVGRCDPNKKPEVVAPGIHILSAWTDGGYAHADGTSQAAPFVTSVVALMLEGRQPPRDRADVLALKEVLADTAQHVAGQQVPHDRAAGYGIVQAVAAIDAYAP